MDRDTALAWMALQQLPGSRNPATHQLARTVTAPQALLTTPAAELAAAGIPAKWINSRQRWQADTAWRDDLQQRYERMLGCGGYLMAPNDSAWPDLLSEIPDPPFLLYLRGDPALLAQPQIAVVGSRKASQQGLANAAAFAKEMASAGLTVTSGMALGIDTQAHQGALAAAGNTIAVLGTGIDVCYPKRNVSLQADIVASGLLVTEWAPGTPPMPENFPARNRIISGLAVGVLVVEATLRSGSLITARLALEQNREVFAIPGSIHQPASRGCNQLLQQGAKLVTCVADILEEFSDWGLNAAATCKENELVGRMQTGLQALVGFEPTTLDALEQASGKPVAQLLPELMQLQLQGVVEQVGGSWQRCR